MSGATKFFLTFWNAAVMLALLGTLKSGLDDAQMYWSLAGLILLWASVITACLADNKDY